MTRVDKIEDAAAGWLIRREEADWSDADESEFRAWLHRSVAHKAAYWRLEFGWREADRIGALGLAEKAPSKWRTWAQQWRPMALAASVILVVGLGFVLGDGRSLSPGESDPDIEAIAVHHATPIGKQKTVSLDDGSIIELNTRTKLRTAISPERREVWLDDGEAFFEVAHIEDRPFVVHAGSRTVTVLGTKFSVRRDGDNVTVSVVEGRVEIGDANARPLNMASVILAGDVAVSKGNSTAFLRKQEERVRDDIAWREGILNFDGKPLAEVVSEFNRYHDRKIEIVDPQAAAIRIGGRFQASNVDAFLRLLEDAYGLDVDRSGVVVKVSGT